MVTTLGNHTLIVSTSGNQNLKKSGDRKYVVAAESSGYHVVTRSNNSQLIKYVASCWYDTDTVLVKLDVIGKVRIGIQLSIFK